MRTRLSTVVCLILTAATLAGQDGQVPGDPQLPVFRTQADLVRVDMYATTRGGRFVPDLRADEIELYEDGVRQRVESFEYVRIAPGAAGPAVSQAAPQAAPAQDARSRVFVVFVDTHTTRLDSQPDLRRSLVRFLDELLGPTDLVGLMTPDMVAKELRLGTRATVVSDFANDERWITRERVPEPDRREFAWENCYGLGGGGGRGHLNEMKARYRGVETIEALTDLVMHLRDLREERKAVLLVTGGWPFMDGSVLQRPGRAETDSCAKDRLALDRVDFGGLLKGLTRAANRANVSFYPVSSRRERVLSRELPAATRQVMRQRDRRTIESIQGQLRSLAEDTDGLAEVKTVNLATVTARILDDTSSYYLIGYQSTNTKGDNKFRTITVKTSRSGVRLRARRGYGGEPPPPRVLLAAAPAIVKPVVDGRVLMALTLVERFDGLAPYWGRSSSWGLPAEDGGGAFWYVGELGARTRTEIPWSAGATAEVEVVAPDKTKVMTRTIDLRPSGATFVLRVPPEGVLPPGDYSVRVRLTAAADDELSVHDTTRVRIEPVTTSIGEPVLWRRGSSVRSAYEETADPRFRRTERLRFEFPTTVEGEATARMLDRAGQPLSIPAGVTERTDGPDPDALQWLVVEAPIAALAPGDYAIEVSQNGSSRVAAFRIVP